MNCGDACSECDSGFNKTLGLCHTCDVHDVQVSVVINRINTIGTVEYTPECKAKIDAATAAYNSLTDDQKSLVSNYNDLRNAGRGYARLKAAEDQRKANMVINGINNIGEVTYTGECNKKIAIAKKAYGMLTADQKALVTNYNVLAAADAKYKELRDAANASAEDKSASDSVISKINAIGTVAYSDSSKFKIDIARKAYNELTANQKALVTNYNTLTAAEAKYNELKAAADKAAADKAAADAVIAKIKAIGTVEYTSACKAKIDDARSAYNALTADGKKLVTNYSVLTAAEAEYANLEAKAASEAAVNAVTAKIKAIGNVEYTSACKAKIDDARSAYNALTALQKEQVFNYNTLTAAETKYAKLKADADKAAADKAAANAATAKISAIGTVEYTSASKSKIDAARAAYNALTAEQKTMVSNYAVLKAAESKYAELKAAAEKSAADKTAADAVTAKIAAIGKVEYTVASKTVINSARIAYNALSADQKPLVTNYGTLTAAEAKYNELKAAAEDPENPKIVKGVSLGGDIKLDCKKTAVLNPTIDADPGAKYTVKYESSNPKVATVDQNGNVFAAKRGTANIKVTVTDSNGNVVTDTCKVTVKYTFIQWIIVILLFGWIWF